MTPEEIRKQMFGSAGLSEAPLSKTRATKSSADTKTTELPAEVTSASPEDERQHSAEDQIASDEIPVMEGGEAPQTKKAPSKSLALAFALALLFGPLGLLYVSWKRAGVMLLVFIIGVSLIPKNGFIVLLLWFVVPILSIVALGVGKRQPQAA